MKEHETRPTPETDAVADEAFNLLILNDRGIEAVTADFARKLERERDELREANVAIQAREAELVLSKAREANVAIQAREAIREAHAALKELRSFYIEMTGLPPCAANAVLEKLKPFLP
jgi:hypothetical protein